MRRLLNKSSLAFLAKIVGLTLLIFGVYYLLYFRPVILLSRALTASETRLLEQRNQLLVSRVALTGFTRLDPASADLGQTREDLLSRLRQSNTDGLALAEKASRAAPLSGSSRPARVFYNEHLLPAETKLSEKMETLLHDQQPIIDQLFETNRVLKNIFLYPPNDDLGLIVRSKESAEALTARAEEAKKGLTAIATNLASFPASKSTTALLSALQKTQTALNYFLHQLPSGQEAAIVQAQRAAIKQFFALKKIALDYELSLIRSSGTVALLTRQTNLLLEYDFWVENIARHKRTLLSATPL